jgi:hypothetical protein
MDRKYSLMLNQNLLLFNHDTMISRQVRRWSKIKIEKKSEVLRNILDVYDVAQR